MVLVILLVLDYLQLIFLIEENLEGIFYSFIIYRSVAVYDGSWSEYGGKDYTPYEKTK